MRYKHKKYLFKYGQGQRFVYWLKKIRMSREENVSLYKVLKIFAKNIKEDDVMDKANGVAYNFILAIFPTIIFLFTLIPYIPKRIGFQEQLMSLLALVLPNNAFLAFEATINDIVNIQNGSLLSLGFLLSLFFATNGVHNLMMAFNKSSLIVETRTWLKQRIVALILTFVLALSVIMCIAAMAIGEILLTYLQQELHYKGGITLFAIQLTRWSLLGVFYFITVSILYRYGPAHAKKWKFFSAGSWLATILAFVTMWGFSYYINNFGSYNKI